MANILVIEDNELIRESVVSYLELDNHQVYAFEKVAGVLEAMKHKMIDLIILDVMLPDGNGFILAKRIREEYHTPIIFLTAKTSESDRITGFEIGGDDYVVKPFSPKELTMRVRSILKRTQSVTNDKKISFTLDGVQLKIEDSLHKVFVNDGEIHLTSAEWEILHHLANHAGMVISRSRLLGECLDYMAEGSERTIDTHVKNIRAKLGEPRWIETVRNYGYRFSGKSL